MPRKRPAVDPALAARVRAAVAGATGLEARVAAGKLEIPFGDEHDLAEIAEAFERLGIMAAGSGD
jgi:hypothetical protein